MRAGPESEGAIKTIRLQQPGHLLVHVEEIAHVESLTGNDEDEGTWITLRGIAERRYCLEPKRKVLELIEEAESHEEIKLDALAVGLLLKAADKSAGGRLQFTGNPDGLTVITGATRLEQLQGRDRSKYEHVEQQLSGYALVVAESTGVYRLNERGWVLAEFLAINRHPDGQPFYGFAKLSARPSDATAQIGVQFNQWNNNHGAVNNAISEKGDVQQSVE